MLNLLTWCSFLITSLTHSPRSKNNWSKDIDIFEDFVKTILTNYTPKNCTNFLCRQPCGRGPLQYLFGLQRVFDDLARDHLVSIGTWSSQGNPYSCSRQSFIEGARGLGEKLLAACTTLSKLLPSLQRR
jgi:hypothetical protein